MTIHNFSTGRMEYDTASKIKAERNEYNSKRSVDESDSSPEMWRSGSPHIDRGSYSKAKARRSSGEDLRGGGELYRLLLPRGPLSRDSAFHSWTGSQRS